MIRGYDQWKTAYPPEYDDEYPELEANCPKCNSEDYEIDGWDCDTLDFNLICQDCGEKYDFNSERPKITDKQLAEINELQEIVNKSECKARPMSLDEFFNVCDDGDFKWIDSEAGDWSVYCCGEKDCSQQWHMTANSINMGRENGKRWVEIHSGDQDGNWDFDSGYDEREGDSIETWEWLAKQMACESYEYFRGWADYWLDAAQTGKDPCEQSISNQPNWVEFCIKSAKDMIKYL